MTFSRPEKIPRFFFSNVTLNMFLNLVNRLYRRYNNVKTNKNATAGLYVI